MRITFLLFITIILSGCVAKQKYDYFDLSSKRIEQKITTDAVALGIVKDSRPYELSGDKEPNFFALSRIYGAPITQNHPQYTHISLLFADHVKASLNRAMPNLKLIAINDTVSTFESVRGDNPEYDYWLTFEMFEWKNDIPE